HRGGRRYGAGDNRRAENEWWSQPAPLAKSARRGQARRSASLDRPAAAHPPAKGRQRSPDDAAPPPPSLPSATGRVGHLIPRDRRARQTARCRGHWRPPALTPGPAPRPCLAPQTDIGRDRRRVAVGKALGAPPKIVVEVCQTTRRLPAKV